ncbi:amidohydrolase [Undibacterium sp. Ren11W]|uniref:amidohydrolase n=1 Tax=Undibacterium sp. Ren11W TaxID=3413045 RepID=UPI003BF31C22
MLWKIFAGASILVLGLVGCMSGGDGAAIIKPAAIVLRGGKVMTMDANNRTAQAVAVNGNRIVAVGTDEEIARYIGPNTQVINLNGKTLLPGFIDTHIHPVSGAERLAQCSVDGAALSVADIITYALQDCLPKEVNPAADKWIQIVNVNPANFAASAADLDRISTSRPVLLAGIDGHTSWVNTKALALAHIDVNTPDPSGGQIERDSQGQATGFLKDAAQGLVMAIIPELSFSEKLTLTQQALDLVRSKGITSIQDAWASPQVMEVYEALEKTNQLNMRVRVNLKSDIVDSEAEYQRLLAIRAHFAGHSLIRADGVKIFSDGVIEYPTQTSAMMSPFLDENGNPTENFGGRYFEPGVLNRYVARLDKEGFSLNVHSIGDFTTHAVLDSFQYARDKNGVSDNRHQISHLQIVDPADFSRFAKLGVAANMQLFWAEPDEYTMDAVAPFIRPETHRYMYPAASLKAAGATLIGGSDWPVDAIPGDPMPNTPLATMQIAITRQNAQSDSPHFGEILHIEESTDLHTMLAAYTINAAKAIKQDASTGSIEVGKLADLVVLDSDLSSTAAAQLDKVQVLYTLFGGAIVYDASKLQTTQKMQQKRVMQSSAMRSDGMPLAIKRQRRSHDMCGHDH